MVIGAIKENGWSYVFRGCSHCEGSRIADVARGLPVVKHYLGCILSHIFAIFTIASHF